MAITHTAGLEPSRQRKSALRLVRLALLLIGPVTLVCILASGPILATAFGEQYRDAAPALAVLMASAPPGAVVLVLTPVVAVGDGRRFAAAVAVTLVPNISLNLSLHTDLRGCRGGMDDPRIASVARRRPRLDPVPLHSGSATETRVIGGLRLLR